MMTSLDERRQRPGWFVLDRRRRIGFGKDDDGDGSSSEEGEIVEDEEEPQQQQQQEVDGDNGTTAAAASVPEEDDDDDHRDMFGEDSGGSCDDDDEQNGGRAAAEGSGGGKNGSAMTGDAERIDDEDEDDDYDDMFGGGDDDGDGVANGAHVVGARTENGSAVASRSLSSTTMVEDEMKVTMPDAGAATTKEDLTATSSSRSDDGDRAPAAITITPTAAATITTAAEVDLTATDAATDKTMSAAAAAATGPPAATTTTTKTETATETKPIKVETAADVLARLRKRRKLMAATATAASSSSSSAATATAAIIPKRRKSLSPTPLSSLGVAAAGEGRGQQQAGPNDSIAGPPPRPLPQRSITRHYPKIEPELYWKTLREWDFASDLNEMRLPSSSGKHRKKKKRRRMASSSGGSSSDSDGRSGDVAIDGDAQVIELLNSDDEVGESDDDDDEVEEKEKTAEASDRQRPERQRQPLPDTFESARQYAALWSPLLLDEVKSQALSDVDANLRSLSPQSSLTIPVTVDVARARSDGPHRGGGSGSSSGHGPLEESITLVLRMARGAAVGGAGGGAMMHDLFFLVMDPSMISSAARGTLLSPATENGDDGGGQQQRRRRLGFVCHAVNSRSNRSWDGLMVSASRKMWRDTAGKTGVTMHLFKIGSNVTALREYGALCKVDKIPLTKYLLDGKVGPAGHHHQGQQQNNGPSDPLSTTAGQDALGIGFRIYAKSKFNPSQLGAIGAAAREYGDGGFTLVKGPPGTGKTTTLVALLNALHLRQYQRYYAAVERIVVGNTPAGGGEQTATQTVTEEIAALHRAADVKPRILVCAPSNAAIDNVLLKIMEDRFVDGNGGKYSPSIVRVGVGQSSAVRHVSLKEQVDAALAKGTDVGKLQELVTGCRRELGRFLREIQKLKRRLQALVAATPWDLSSDWEVRIDEETFDRTSRVLYINHATKTATVDLPRQARSDEQTTPLVKMPHYRSLMDSLTKYVERHNTLTSDLELYVLLQNAAANAAMDGRGGARHSQAVATLTQDLETHILDASHIVMTTLGSAGSRAVETAAKFEVVVVDEAAQSSEPSTLVALQLGSSHAILVGDPQQLPATIFSVSGRITKYDRSLFQRLEESGHPVHMLNTQYRMDPAISEFPRRIFYDGKLLDGPNVQSLDYGGLLSKQIRSKFPFFQPFTIFDLDSLEERDGTSLSNSDEARLALHLYCTLDRETGGMSSKSRIAVVTPYSQQVALLRRTFMERFGESVTKLVEISTVDAFQGREAGIVIFSCVRGAGRGVGIGFLADVQRMNVALTRAKHFLFVIARRRSIMVNPYWRDLIRHAREKSAILQVPVQKRKTNPQKRKKKDSGDMFPNLKSLIPLHQVTSNVMAHRAQDRDGYISEGEFSA